MVPSIHMCTVAESDNLGIFFLEFFTLINDWTDEEVWNKSCEGYSGFSKMVVVGQETQPPQPIKLGDFIKIQTMI